jgi:hypothetical protein
MKLKRFNEFNRIKVYHGGNIEGDIKPPIYFTQDEYVAKGYGDEVYTFYLDISNFLDLTNIETFQSVKKKVYDNYSKLFKNYKTYGGFDGYSKERMLKEYTILSKYKDYETLHGRYLEIVGMDFMQDFFDGDFRGTSDNIDDLYELSRGIRRGELNYDMSVIEILREFEVIEHQVRNMNKMDDYSLNMFGRYFYDYSIDNDYDGYMAWSSDATGRVKIIEYCLNNINKLYHLTD